MGRGGTGTEEGVDVNLDVCSSSEGIVVARYGLGDIQIPGWPRVPDTLQVLTPISICVEAVTFITSTDFQSETHACTINLNPDNQFEGACRCLGSCVDSTRALWHNQGLHIILCWAQLPGSSNPQLSVMPKLNIAQLKEQAGQAGASAHATCKR